MDTKNCIINHENYTDSSYDGLSQDEVRRLQEMAPELRDALLRLRRNIHRRDARDAHGAEART